VPEEYAGNDFLRRCRNLEKRIYQGVEEIESPRVFKKWVFSKVLFDEKNEGPDEYDFYFNTKRFSINTCRVTSKIFLLESPLNLGKKFRHGKFFFYFRRKYSKENAIQKQISFSYRVGLLFKAFKYSKIEALMLIVLKALDFLSFSLGMFMGYFDRRIQRICLNIKEEFDMIGGDYELHTYHGSLGNEFVDRIEREVTLKELKEIFNESRIKVLDIGAGEGRWTGEFLKMGYDVTALDISEKMCEYLKKKFMGLKVIRGDIESARLNEKYDLIFSFRSFKYVLNRKRALENIKNHLKKGGYAVIEMPNKYNPFYFILYIVAPIIYVLTGKRLGKYFILADFVSEKEFKKELEELGFNVVKTVNLFFFPHWLYSRINEHLIPLVYGLDRKFSQVFPRSIIYICKL